MYPIRQQLIPVIQNIWPVTRINQKLAAVIWRCRKINIVSFSYWCPCPVQRQLIYINSYIYYNTFLFRTKKSVKSKHVAAPCECGWSRNRWRGFHTEQKKHSLRRAIQRRAISSNVHLWVSGDEGLCTPNRHQNPRKPSSTLSVVQLWPQSLRLTPL